MWVTPHCTAALTAALTSAPWALKVPSPTLHAHAFDAVAPQWRVDAARPQLPWQLHTIVQLDRMLHY